jgi:hypothetical protein
MIGGRCGLCLTALIIFLGALAARFGISAGGIRRGSAAYASGSSPSLVEFTVSNQIENAKEALINVAVRP